MLNRLVILSVVFFKTRSGTEPVRDWLRSMTASDKKTIGEDIKTVQFGWPMGMPLVEKLSPGLWETRSKVTNGIVRIFFTIAGQKMILLHGFIKKSQRLPRNELDTAILRLRQYQEETHE